MTKTQKEIQQAYLNSEKATLEELKSNYKEAIAGIDSKIAELMGRNDADMQHVVYQIDFQKSLKKQNEAILQELQDKNFKSVSDYLTTCYEDGFIGTMYDLQSQGIPLILPMNQSQIVDAIKTKSKLSSTLYDAFDMKDLQKTVAREIARGFSSSMTFSQIAQNIQNRANISLNQSIRIARTEGHRIQTTASMDACEKAKEKGADVVKQWDATLDSRTRESHAMVDGEIRELDEPFSNGLMFPSDPSGDASEVINCRCALLQRARWALDEGELETLKERAEFYGLDKTDNFEDFKAKYLKASDDSDEEWENFLKNYKVVKNNDENYLFSPLKSSSDQHADAILKALSNNNIYYQPVKSHETAKTNETIINDLAGGDKTKGSCASVGLAYIGQEQGWEVLDFRDGESRSFFSRSGNLWSLSKMEGISAVRYGDVAGKSSCTLANNFLKTCEEGKEYYLCTGRHASIVRKVADDIIDDTTGEIIATKGQLQYLELQSANNSGWHNFNENPRYTLTQRFGCSSSSGHGEMYDFMMDITDSDFETPEFRSILGYINTLSDGQNKGFGGTIK